MHESVTERRCVEEEGLRVVNFCYEGRTLTVPHEKGAPNSVPEGSVIQRPQALPGIIGRKGSVGGYVRLLLNPWAQPIGPRRIRHILRQGEVSGTPGEAVKCVDIRGNTNCEGS
jgi:hypothetical protein